MEVAQTALLAATVLLEATLEVPQAAEVPHAADVPQAADVPHAAEVPHAEELAETLDDTEVTVVTAEVSGVITALLNPSTDPPQTLEGARTLNSPAKFQLESKSHCIFKVCRSLFC